MFKHSKYLQYSITLCSSFSLSGFQYGAKSRLDRFCVIFLSVYSLNLEVAVKVSFSQILLSLIRVLKA